MNGYGLWNWYINFEKINYMFIETLRVLYGVNLWEYIAENNAQIGARKEIQK